MGGKVIDLTDKRFGMLNVTRRADNINGSTAWYCDCDCGTKDFVVLSTKLRNKKVQSCGCDEIKKTSEHKKMTEKEIQDWNNLYEYVRKNIMGYDENQALSSTMCLRLKGLLVNKFMFNNKQKDGANYSYEVILNTFKYCYNNIQKALRTNRFKDERHKFNYVLKIVEGNINDVYLRMKNAEKAKEEAKNIVVEAPTHIGAEFKPKENKKDRFSNLW